MNINSKTVVDTFSFDWKSVAGTFKMKSLILKTENILVCARMQFKFCFRYFIMIHIIAEYILPIVVRSRLGFVELKIETPELE